MGAEKLLNKTIKLPTHFPEPVEVESITRIGNHYKLRVRTIDGYLDEVMVTKEEIEGVEIISKERYKPVDPKHLSLLVESHRIRYAYSYDPYFAVSLSGIQTLPHQIEAVYGRMLPQSRLRFLLADDPGAGKTIMAGLLIKEMKMRYAIEKILIIVPASLRIQWQDELLRFLAMQGTGRVRQSIALTRTVFQRRLASSTFAIYQSLERRLKKQKEFLEELERLSPTERLRLLERRRGVAIDEEMDEGDMDEQDRDILINEFTCAREINEIKEEIVALKDLVEKAKIVYERTPDTKLKALKECLERAEFAELKDGRGKLLIFTEHRVIAEIQETPDFNLGEKMMQVVKNLSILRFNKEAEQLSGEYVRYSAIPEKYKRDAFHLGIATVNRIEILLSWNYKHIVRRKTKKIVKIVNELYDYPLLEIMAPPEILGGEE